MKRFLFGMLLAVIGLAFSSFCFAWAVIHPWNYNGIDGLLGSFLGTGTLPPFLEGTAILLVGVLICGLEAYHRK